MEATERHLFEYRHDGADWALEIIAASREDAEARLKKLPWAKYRGRIYASGKLPGWLGRFFAKAGAA